MGGLNDAFRAKLNESFQRMKAGIASCLSEAQSAGEIAQDLDTDETADFILNNGDVFNDYILTASYMKAQKSTEPLALFSRFVFERVLRK